MEILFRGKRVDNGEWVYGVPVIGNLSGVFMVWVESKAKRGCGDLLIRDVVKQSEVIPETVGQYTGLSDRNGVKIFDGDIVKNGESAVYADKTTKRFVNVGVVKFDVKHGCMVIHNTNGTTKRLTKKTIDVCKIKIIGNTTFNQELLEERE